uniref:Uncharacterized protein n=1 Tax=Oryza nivara TaxID=4536 RepID=A0A0E0IEI2_ORYNI
MRLLRMRVCPLPIKPNIHHTRARSYSHERKTPTQGIYHGYSRTTDGVHQRRSH